MTIGIKESIIHQVPYMSLIILASFQCLSRSLSLMLKSWIWRRPTTQKISENKSPNIVYYDCPEISPEIATDIAPELLLVLALVFACGDAPRAL